MVCHGNQQLFAALTLHASKYNMYQNISSIRDNTFTFTTVFNNSQRNSELSTDWPY